MKYFVCITHTYTYTENFIFQAALLFNLLNLRKNFKQFKVFSQRLRFNNQRCIAWIAKRNFVVSSLKWMNTFWNWHWQLRLTITRYTTKEEVLSKDKYQITVISHYIEKDAYIIFQQSIVNQESTLGKATTCLVLWQILKGRGREKVNKP